MIKISLIASNSTKKSINLLKRKLKRVIRLSKCIEMFKTFIETSMSSLWKLLKIQFWFFRMFITSIRIIFDEIKIHAFWTLVTNENNKWRIVMNFYKIKTKKCCQKYWLRNVLLTSKSIISSFLHIEISCCFHSNFFYVF